MTSYQHNDDYETSQQRIEYKLVPSNLIPTEPSKITLMHAFHMKSYAHIFDPNKFRNIHAVNDIDNDPLMHEWKTFLSALKIELFELGYKESTKHIVSVFQNAKCLDPATGKPPVSYPDVLHLISTKEWYNKDIFFARQIIHTMLYGMYRDGMNAWFNNACQYFRDKYHIKEFATTKERKGCGFVASCIRNNASGKIQRSVKRIMNQNHHEFVSCRQLPLEQKLLFTETKLKIHSTWTAYLYKQKSNCVTDTNSATDLQNSVEHALRDNWSPQQVLDEVTSAIKLYHQKQVITDTSK